MSKDKSVFKNGAEISTTAGRMKKLADLSLMNFWKLFKYICKRPIKKQKKVMEI